MKGWRVMLAASLVLTLVHGAPPVVAQSSTETWDSNWGTVTITYGGTGSWDQGGGKIGQITSSRWDPAAMSLTFTYHQSWNQMTGQALLTLSDDGMTLYGTWAQKPDGSSGGWTDGGGWIATRNTPSVLLRSTASADYDVAPSGASTEVVGQTDSPDGGSGTNPCAERDSAYDRMLLRAKATQMALENLRSLQAEFDLAYEDIRASAYADAVVDLAGIAVGWPLGQGVIEAFTGKVEQSIMEDIIKGGFKSVDQALLKDPTWMGAWNQLTSATGTPLDVTLEGAKSALKKVAEEQVVETAFTSLDLIKLGYGVSDGMTQLEAARARSASVGDKIVQLQAQQMEQMDMLDTAKRAQSLCYDRLSKGLPVEDDNLFWREIQAYLGTPSGTGTTGRVPGPTPTAEPVYVYLLGANGGIGFAIATATEVKTKPSCKWTGGGNDCSQPVSASQQILGPYPSVADARAALKSQLICRSGHWGPQAQWGSGAGTSGLSAGGWYWLQNNVTLSDCKVVQ